MTRAVGQLDKPARRRAMRLAIVNGTLWYAGNALTTGTLVIYLALDLGARGMSLSLILAAPALSGLLRLLTPRLIVSLGGAKRASVQLFSLSYGILSLLPGLIFLPDRAAIAGLIVLLCVHQTLEYMGTVSLWTWLGALVPRRVRGRYFARRQMWQLAVAIPLILAGGMFADLWRETFPAAARAWSLLAYVIPFATGCLLLVGSIVPLTAMPPLELSARAAMPSGVSLTRVWQSASFRRLLYFGCWLSLANGVVQTAQNIYPKQVLQLPVLPLETMRVGMRIGQIGVSWWTGPLADRYGNRAALIVSQLLLGAAPLFFLAATPAHPWWLAGAWLLWSLYAVQNICLPNLALRLSQEDDFAPYLSMYFATTGLCYAAATVFGGWMYDRLAAQAHFTLAGLELDHFQVIFLGSWITRTAAVLWLLRLREDRY
ncbi:MAG: hypothetical protein KF708_00295 [Pirellulales bacterium]|nr:hypothetical protein [Pirellulales bacterium]